MEIGPEFIIAGMPKCGTTSLHRVLSAHPDISMPPGEVHFFDRHFNSGMEWYYNQFRNLTGGVLGERTPAYSHKYHTHPLLKKHLPNVKIILAFRNPIYRAFSAWNMRCNHKDFSTKINGVLSSPRRKKNHEMLKKGRYIQSIRRLLEFYPQDQLHFIITERISRPSVMTKLQEFIGVPVIDLPFQQKWNVGQYKDAMEESTREKLKQYFQPWNEKLFDFLGEEIPEWKE